MKLSIATIIVASTTTATANIASSSHQDDFIHQHLQDVALASGSTKLLKHLDDFTQIREDVAARRLHEVDTEECFFGYATEYIEDYNRFATDDSDDDWEPTGMYAWGTNAVCDDTSTGAIDPDDVPKERFSDGEIYQPSYCADSDGVGLNADIIGSATGHCFNSAYYINSEGINDSGPCGGKGPCEWSCQEVMIINDDYLFLEYIFKPATQEEYDAGDGDVSWGQFPYVYDVIVRDGTGCYDTNGRIHIIPGYVAYGNTYYVYDLSKLGKKSKHSKKSKSYDYDRR